MKNLKIKNIVLVIVALILVVFFIVIGVKIASGKDGNSNVVLGKKVEIGKDESDGSKVSYKRATLNGLDAYSIDYGAEEPQGELTFRKYASDAVMAVLMKGYPNLAPGQMGLETEEEAYIATQMAIWEVMNRTGESLKATSQFRVNNITLKDGMEKVKIAAQNLVLAAENDQYDKVPTLYINNGDIISITIDDDVLVGPYIVSVIDTEEGTIKSITAELTQATDDISLADKSGNPLEKIESGDSVYVKFPKSHEDTNIKVKFKSEIDRVVGEIYEVVGKDYQDFCVLTTTPASMEKELEIEWSKDGKTSTGIHLTNKDENGNAVKGTLVEIVNEKGKVLGESYTGDKGTIKYDNLPVGKYTVRIKSSPEGYSVKKSEFEVTVEANKVVDLDVTSQK